MENETKPLVRSLLFFDFVKYTYDEGVNMIRR